MKTSILFLMSIASSLVLFAQVPEPISPVGADAPATPKGEDVGISANDGISVSGKDILITRNGLSERLAKEMRLSNGTLVRPDGTITLSDGKQLSLKVDQVLTFEGSVREVPPRVNPAPAPTPPPVTALAETNAESSATSAPAATMQDGIIVYNGIPYLIRKGRASVIDRNLVPQGQMLMNDGSFAPIPSTLKEFPAPVVRKGTQQQTRIGEQGVSPTKRGNTTTGNGTGRRGFTRE